MTRSDVRVGDRVRLRDLPDGLDLSTRNALRRLVGREGFVEWVGESRVFVRFDGTGRRVTGRFWVRPFYLDRL